MSKPLRAEAKGAPGSWMPLQLLWGCKPSSSCGGYSRSRFSFGSFRSYLGNLDPCPSSHPPPRLRKMAFSHLASHSPARRSYGMAQSAAPHGLGVRLLWRLDSTGSLVFISHYSSPIALVSDTHWLSCVS